MEDHYTIEPLKTFGHPTKTVLQASSMSPLPLSIICVKVVLGDQLIQL